MSAFTDYKVADMSLADWGRKEINIGRNRDAGPHGPARGIWRQPATERCTCYWLSTHDDPDRGS